MSASRETISHPQLRCCQSKKRLCLQFNSSQYNQQNVLRISFSKSLSKSTFLSKGIKKDMLFVLDIMQVTFVTEPIVDLPTTGFNSEGKTRKRRRAMLRSTCLLSSSSRYLGSKRGGPRRVLGLRGKAVHA